jgi:hypothetical protein
MDDTNIRYMIEHQLLPKWFFNEGEDFIASLLENENMLCQIFNSIYENEGIEFPYTPEDFAIIPLNMGNDSYCIMLLFPDPKVEPQCKYSFMFFTPDLTFQAFYTVEVAISFFNHEKSYFVCEWTKDEMHKNYGQHPIDDIDELIQKCHNWFLESMTAGE